MKNLAATGVQLSLPRNGTVAFYFQRYILRNWPGYLWGAALVALATLAGELMKISFSPSTIDMVFLLCVLITAIFWGLGPSFFVSVLSVLAQDYFFVSPPYKFGPIEPSGYLILGIFLVVSFSTSYITSWARRKTEEARSRELEATTLYSLSQDLAAYKEIESCVNEIEKRMEEIFGFKTTIFLSDGPEGGQLRTFGPAPVEESEFSAARRAFDYPDSAGGANSSSNAGQRFFLLSTARGKVGVVLLRSSPRAADSNRPEIERLLRAFVNLAAVSIESIQLDDRARQAGLLKEKEKLQSALFSSISHDLRTPLVSVIGVLGSLKEDGVNLAEDTRRNLVRMAYDEAERLNRVIANLLDISRLESGAISLSCQPSDLTDLVGVAIEQLGARAESRTIETRIPSVTPFLDVDFNLIVQVLVNLLDNALKYSDQSTTIEVGARAEGGYVDVSVADRGPGIPVSDLGRIFEKFYRGRGQSGTPGTGLGLSICKGIVEAHGGKISAANREGGGTIFSFSLPAYQEAA